MTPAARDRWRVEAPILALTAAAWFVLIVRPGGSALAGSCCTPTSLREGFSPISLQMLMIRNPPQGLALGWLMMLVAMMAPLMSTPIRHVIDRSFARRRGRSVALFVLGYVGVWMTAGVPMVSAALAVRLFYPTSFVPVVIGCLVAMLWQSSPAKQKCLNRGHAHPELAAFGAKADVDALRFGLMHGVWCVGSCWALMLLPELFPAGHLAAMAIVTLWLLAEKLDKPAVPRWRLRGAGKGARIVVAQTRMIFR